ncbi:MAG: EAL domain-containing protein [Actinomycetia bacterium]|nr:EAL domain-containing protein [Actinomycetes bacterium]
MEQAWAASELGELVDALPDAVILVDSEANLTWGNQAAAHLFGRTLESSIGLNALEFVHPDDVGVALTSLESVVGKKVGTPIELRVRAADGWHTVELVGTPVGDSILMVLRDLTERRRWELAGDHTERFRVILQNAAPPTLLLDANGTVTSSSAALTRAFGVDQEWLEGRPLSVLAKGADAQAIEDVLSQMSPGDTREGLRRHVDVTLTCADGSSLATQLELANLLDDPTVEAIVVSIHDVSRRARAEEDVRHTNSLLAATLDATAEGVLAVNLSGAVTGYNERFVEMWNMPPDVIDSHSALAMRNHVSRHVIDPEAFMSKAAALYDNPEQESHDVIEFLDGRVIERDSRPQRLDGRTIGRVWSFRDVTAKRALQAELEHQATHDELTGLANRALFRRRVDEAAQSMTLPEDRLAVLFVELDSFKTVNDSLGHSAGNEMLVEVARRLRDCVRTQDTVARLGGDEFAVLVRRFAERADAEEVARRILSALGEPITVAGRSMSADACIGIAYGAAQASTEDLIRNAELAMYVAKQEGRNRFMTYVEEMHDEAVRRLEVASRLRGAAARGELVVHYQPVVETHTGAIRSLEALVRWHHPEQGLLLPLQFIPLAEESDLIDEIGEHVLEVACAEAGQWQEMVGEDWAPSVSVNLAPRQLLDDRLTHRIAEILHATNMNPARLTLEITESALMQDPVMAARRLAQIRNLGVALALDDFGTGHSSLSHLQKFPLDTLKVDRQFVDEVETPTGNSLVGAITQLAHTLGMGVVAEGVETEDQRYALEMLGCDLAQGYLFARPLNADQTSELLRGARAASTG